MFKFAKKPQAAALSAIAFSLSLGGCSAVDDGNEARLVVWGNSDDVSNFFVENLSAGKSWTIKGVDGNKNFSKAVISLPENSSGSDIIQITRQALKHNLSYKL